MKIALDYDDTITRDPAFWRNFVLMAKNHGHEVRIVTFRYQENCDVVKQFADSVGISYIATNHNGKRLFCAHVGWMPDVWVDDSPEFVVLEEMDRDSHGQTG